MATPQALFPFGMAMSRQVPRGYIYLLAQLQEAHHLQRLSDIRDLLAQSLAAALGVHLHELVLGDHLLEGAEGWLDLLAGGDVVADIVDEGGDRNPARVGLCCYRAKLEGSVLVLASVARDSNRGWESNRSISRCRE